MADDLFQNPAVITREVVELNSSGTSSIGDMFTKGIPAAAISGTLSIANTFLDYAGKEAYDVQQAVESYDQAAGQYYAEHKEDVDVVGFVGASLVPGGIGIKALQLARAGNAAGVAGRALNFAASRRNAAMEQAIKEIGTNGGTFRSLLSSAARRKQLGWEVADQALLSIAAETAVLATMNDSPLFDQDTFGDFTENFAIGVALGGGIGGALGSFGARGILKEAQSEVQKSLRGVDTLFAYDRAGLTKGTELLAFADDIARLPAAGDNTLFKYRGGEVEIPTAGLFQGAREKAVRLGKEKLALEFNTLAEGNADVGQAYFGFIQRRAEAAREAGKGVDEVSADIVGYLQNVSRVKEIDEVAMAADARRFYATLDPVKNATDELEKWTGGAFTTNRGRSARGEAYTLNEGVEPGNLKIADLRDMEETSLKAAFKNQDVDILRMPDGSMRVNPNSKNISSVKDNPFMVKKFMDLETGTIMPETTVTFGDTITKAGAQWGQDFIAAGRKHYPQLPTQAFDLAVPAVEASARWAWASKLSTADLLRLTGGRIAADDLPLLQRFAELAGEIAEPVLKKFKVVVNGEDTALEELGARVGDFAHFQRLDLLQEQLARWDIDKMGSLPDTRAIAAHLNVSVDWVENAIAKNFTTGISEELGEVFATANALKPKTVQVEWDLTPVKGQMTPEAAYNMNMGPQNMAVKELTKQYQIEVQTRVTTVAGHTMLGDAVDLIPDLNNLSRRTDAEGAGASVLGAANANYGSAAQAVEQAGRGVALASQRARDAVVLSLAPYKNAIAESQIAIDELGIVTNALRKNPNKFVFDDLQPRRLISQEVVQYAKANEVTIDEAIGVLTRDAKHAVTYTIETDSVAQFLRQHASTNHAREGKFAVGRRARGLTPHVSDQPIVYVPPIDTVRYPYHAFVRTKDQIGIATDVSMITARTEAELRALTAKVDSKRFDVLFDKNTENYHKAKGQYQYSETLNEARVNSEMARTGVLNDFFPETRFENVMGDYMRFHANQEEKLIREGVQVMNNRFFSEMTFLSETYRQEAESTFRILGSKGKKSVADPFGDYIKTALNISKQQEVPLLDSLNEFVDKVGLRAGEAIQQAFGQAKMSGNYEMVNRQANRYGLGLPFRDEETYMMANATYPRNIVREGIQKANAALATVTLRLDFANSLINMISTPILLGTELQSIKGLMGKNSELAGKLAELTSIAVPGQTYRYPSQMKLITGGIQSFFGANKTALLERYRKIGANKDIGQKYHEMLDDLSFDPMIGASKWREKVDKGVETAARITGNNFSEELTRFVSADVMRQLSDPLVQAGRMSIKEQDAYIGTFVNRVQGNYVTSQRPLLFQGTAGGAVSLFQTYAFNVLQQLHRHIQAGDAKTVAMFAGLQSTVFGFNGLPFFDAINTHIFGSFLANNPEHKDLYSILPKFNKEAGDWMLYGSASAFPLFTGTAPALYSRGDINPRHLSVIPVNPLDVPAVQAATKAVSAVWNFGKNMAGGVDLSDAMLQGMEHQGLNRPLAGFAQALSGRSTTSKGTLISAASDLETTSFLGALKDRAIDYGGISRVMGARPMDEAVALNQMYRNKTYEALDKQRIERLGTVVKSKLYNGESPSAEEMEDFMIRYARSGGRIENFSQFMQRSYRDANSSIVNQTMMKVNSSTGRKMMDLMGGQMLPDYRNQLDGFSD